MKFTDSRGEVCDTEDIKHATISPIDALGALIEEMDRHARSGRAIIIQPYTFQRWADALTSLRKDR